MGKRKATAFIISTVLVLSTAATAFADIDYSQWNSQPAYPQDVVGTQLFTPVKALMDKKIITGDSDGLYHPEKSITRAEFATIMAKATNNTGSITGNDKTGIFTDMEGYTWAEPYVNACAEAGLIKGVGESEFAPGKEVSYAEAITVIIRTKPSSSSQAETMGAWPDNYIKYAQMFNLVGDIAISDWNTPANKGDIARILYRNTPK